MSYANVVATLALFFAVSGGAAYAASHYLITSTKQIKPSVLASLKGKAGPAGPAGPAGSAGAAGTGTAGSAGPAGPAGPAGTGTEGKEGKGVTSAPFTGPKGTCLEGGTAFTSASGTTYACNGEVGAQGPPGKNGVIHGAEPLPSGATETGVWGIHLPGESEGGKGTEANGFATISFPIQLAAAITEEYYLTVKEQKKENVNCTGLSGPEKTACEAKLTEQLANEAKCPGTVEAPTAPNNGTFCLYRGLVSRPSGEPEPEVVEVSSPALGGPAVGRAGTVVRVAYHGSLSEAIEIEGSWAVTAP